MNDRMTAGDWVFCFAFIFIMLVIAVMLNHHMTKAERLDSELTGLKAECIAKGVAEYGFDINGKVVFKIKNRSGDCGNCRGRAKGENVDEQR